MRGYSVFFACFSVFVPGVLRADDAYSIKLKKTGRGESTRSDLQATDTFRIKLTDSEGKVVQNDENKTSERFVYRETILEMKPEDKKPTRLERDYEKVEITSRGDTRTFAHVGKPVLIEKKNNRYEFQLKGGKALAPKEADFLSREFNDPNEEKIEDEYFLPKKAVAVGEKWKIETAPLIKNFQRGSPMECDAEGAAAVGKLLRVYERDSRRFGVLIIQVELPLKSVSFGKDKITLDKGGKALLTVTLDVCIDGSIESGEMTTQLDCNAKGTFSAPDKKMYTMEITAQSDSKELRKEMTGK